MILKDLFIIHINLLISNVNPIALKRAEKLLPCRPLPREMLASLNARHIQLVRCLINWGLNGQAKNLTLRVLSASAVRELLRYQNHVAPVQQNILS